MKEVCAVTHARPGLDGRVSYRLGDVLNAYIYMYMTAFH